MITKRLLDEKITLLLLLLLLCGCITNKNRSAAEPPHPQRPLPEICFKTDLPDDAYDAALIKTIKSRWYGLLDTISYNSYHTGYVIIQFRLHSDGQVTDVTTKDSTAGNLLAVLCQKAIIDPAPYDRWPAEMLETVGKDYRDIAFTFCYQ